MQSFKPISMVVSTFMVLSVGAFLVLKPNFGSGNFAITSARPAQQDATCIPNDTQWICP
jgi:hypothetical protein